MIVTYTNTTEVIIMLKENEDIKRAEYFYNAGRDIDDYDRVECEDASIEFFPRVRTY